jgi:hypothetical protein
MKYTKTTIRVVNGIKFTGNNHKECLDFCKEVIDESEREPLLIIPIRENDYLFLSKGDFILKQESKVNPNEFSYFTQSASLMKDWHSTID